MKKKTINENAKYIYFKKDGHKILVDMNDIENIVPSQQVIFQGTNKKTTIYMIVFKDKSFWQIPIENEDYNSVETFLKFKGKKEEENKNE